MSRPSRDAYSSVLVSVVLIFIVIGFLLLPAIGIAWLILTIIAAAVLFYVGTGPVRGFAVTLVLGLLANLFTAVYVSRTIFIWELSRKQARHGRVETLSI